MKITAISDLHGYLPDNIENCDVVCIAGDLMPLDIQRDLIKSISWFLLDFKPWAESLPCDKVIFIAGNHDFMFEELGPNKFKSASKVMRQLLGEHKKDSKLVYLCDTLYEYKGKRFYGTPWCPELFNWAFYASDEDLEETFKKIPIKLDVLITHCPPFIGDTGKVLDKNNWNYNRNFGSSKLADAIWCRYINWCVCGHIHTGSHEIDHNSETNIVNVSLKDEDYKVTYEPFVFELN